MNYRSLESQARRAAKQAGLCATKSNAGISLDNLGDFMLIDPSINAVVAGSRYDMIAEEVIEYCSE